MSVAAGIEAAVAEDTAAAGAEGSSASTDGDAEGSAAAESAAGGEQDGQEGTGEAGEPAGASGEAEASPGAPEEYAAFTVEEGWELNEERLSEVTTLFREDDLTQEQAQKYLNQWIESSKELVESTAAQIASEQSAADEAALTQWDEEIESNPKLGGPRREQTKTEIASLIKMFGEGEGGQDTLKALAASGLVGGKGKALGYPPLIALLSKAGAHFTEGTATGQAGMSAEGGGRDRLEHEVMYDKDGHARNHEDWA